MSLIFAVALVGLRRTSGMSHVFGDDPAGMPDEYTVTLTLEDDDGGLTSTTRTVMVQNRAAVSFWRLLGSLDESTDAMAK